MRESFVASPGYALRTGSNKGISSPLRSTSTSSLHKMSSRFNGMGTINSGEVTDVGLQDLTSFFVAFYRPGRWEDFVGIGCETGSNDWDLFVFVRQTASQTFIGDFAS